jgi:hypothetical protein
MSSELPNDIQELLDQCDSDDPIERFEAFEELWDHALHQETPSEHTPSILLKLLEWIEQRHPDWADILDAVYVSALDLAEGPTRTPEENARRIRALHVILQGHALFEAVLNAPCVMNGDTCQSHYAAAGLLGLTLPLQAGRLAASIITLIREQPIKHANLWTVVERRPVFEGVSNDGLHFCAEKGEVEWVRRFALLHLAARGDEWGMGILRQDLKGFGNSWKPSVEESAVLARRPELVSLDLLRDLYSRARDLRAVHDLACGIVRKVARDQRGGWDFVMEMRSAGKLVIRHPEVGPFTGKEPSQETIRERADLLRRSDLHLVDTDLWLLFGLENPNSPACMDYR